MPELPEVEVVRRYLDRNLEGETIESVEVGLPRLVKNAGEREFARSLAGKTILRVERRGKYLILRLSGPVSLMVHLRMTGRLVWLPDKDAPLPPHTHIVFRITKGVLCYGDVRTLGVLKLIPSEGKTGDKGLDGLGPDALSEEFSGSCVFYATRGRRGTVKAFLLDQKNVAGVGNIYADEALFLSGVMPDRAAGDITEKEAERLARAVKSVMESSIKNGGTTFRDFMKGDGKEGGNAGSLFVYGREGEPCRKCGVPIELAHVAGRGTRFCPCCQK